MRTFISYFTVLTLLLTSNSSIAQCISAPAAGNCSGGSGAATNGVTISTGQTYWYSSAGTFSNGITLSGGTLLVCGNLSLSSISFNSGTIIVKSGGSLTINGGGVLNLNSNSYIYNYGSLTINKDIDMSKSNTELINASSSAFLNLSTSKLKIDDPTAYFVNNGISSIDKLDINSKASAGSVCLGVGSCLNLVDLDNDKLNSITAAGANGAIYYSGNAKLNSNLSDTSIVKVCKDGSATTSGSAGWGSASVTSSCSSCATVLPIELISFNAILVANYCKIDWVTASELNNNYFEIYKSVNGQDWEVIDKIEGAGNSTSLLYYTTYDYDIGNEPILYYKLKQTDFNGKYTFSKIIAVKANAVVGLKISPNPFNQVINIDYPNGISLKYRLVNAYGLLISEGKLEDNIRVINTESILPGSYVLSITTPDMETVNFNLLKLF